MKPAGSGVIAAVTDGRTATLEDGRTLRLAGIEVPAFDARPEAEGLALRAKETLQAFSLGAPLTLHRIEDEHERDRYGRILAHAFVSAGRSERWLQRMLVAAGHAQVAAHVGERGCAAALLREERAARAAKLGLWADPYYVIRPTERVSELKTARGRFTIVEGRVLSVRESGGTVYVNFGRQWTEDFTVTIAKRNERMFAAAGLEPKALAGRRVRIRGWVEERGGPWIDVTRPEQIEVAEHD
jgi:endonuclease YncB( thermonuclease family)